MTKTDDYSYFEFRSLEFGIYLIIGAWFLEFLMLFVLILKKGHI